MKYQNIAKGAIYNNSDLLKCEDNMFSCKTSLVFHWRLYYKTNYFFLLHIHHLTLQKLTSVKLTKF